MEPVVATAILKSQQFYGNRFANVKITVDAGQEVMAPTVLDVKEIVTRDSKLKLISAQLRENLTIDGIYEEATRHLHSWNNVKVEAKKVPAGAIAVVAVLTTICTAGVGTAGLGAAVASTCGATTGMMTATMISATVSALCTQITTTLVATGGDLEATMGKLASRDGVMSLATSALSAGVLDGLGVQAPLGYTDFADIAQYSAIKVGVDAGIGVTLGQQNFGDVIRSAGLNFLVSVGGKYCAQEIGKAYGGLTDDGQIDPQGPKIGFIEHKLLHAGLGAGLGAIKGDAAAGAIGGMVGELVADLTKDDVEVIAARVQEKAEIEGIDRKSPEFKGLIQSELQTSMNWGKLGASVVTALAGRDVSVGLEVATNAIENNMGKLLLGLVMKEGVKKATKEGGKQAIKQGAKEGGKNSAKKIAKEKAKEGFSEESKKLIGNTNKYKRELLERSGKAKNQTTLRAAQKELKGEQIDLAKQRGTEYNHIEKVQQAQKGLERHIKAIKNRLGFTKLPKVERQALHQELSEASKLLDHTKQFVPRN
ncbi:polymorphic toxin type 28 domain-containing protein [Candidatus Paracaedibacter symbiosus]|uniref:polymorphic toxin type 28 domain-containing protein n=1 Tax=Candidatus Paracaedibacter symbiosus TaxID=244582 RepID=UPI0018DCDC6B|nr:polymorphic toxin type 28 domain-containing protein [Candidatus Paracaedibacter symbiosus]